MTRHSCFVACAAHSRGVRRLYTPRQSASAHSKQAREERAARRGICLASNKLDAATAQSAICVGPARQVRRFLRGYEISIISRRLLRRTIQPKTRSRIRADTKPRSDNFVGPTAAYRRSRRNLGELLRIGAVSSGEDRCLHAVPCSSSAMAQRLLIGASFTRASLGLTAPHD